MRTLLTTAQVAEKLGYTTGWFYRNRKMLRGLGFPEPVLGTRYDDRAIDQWLDRLQPGRLTFKQEDEIEALIDRRTALIA